MLRVLFLISLFSFGILPAYAEITTQLFRQTGDPVIGNKSGSITMVEFFDYQCSHCVEMYPVVESAIKNNPDLRVVYKLLPVRGPVSELAAKAVLAANKQGKFRALNHALMSTSQPLSENLIYSLARSSGLNVDKLKKDMKSKNIENQIQINMQLAKNLGIQGTPTFYLAKTNANNMSNVSTILGQVSQRELQNSINAAGQ